jgi:four helix bundle protein
VSQGPAAGRGSRVAGRGYQQLRAWQKAHALALCGFPITEELRAKHRWLADQLIRAAVSVAANIAEGYNRAFLREYIQFLNIARGSLAEVEYYALFGRDAGLLLPNRFDDLSRLVDDTGNLLLGLIRSLQAKEGSRSARIIREEPAEYLADEDGGALESPTPDPRPPTLSSSPLTLPKEAS